MPGSLTSTVKRAAPVTLDRPSARGTDLPMTASCWLGASAGASPTGTSRSIGADGNAFDAEGVGLRTGVDAAHRHPFAVFAASSVAAIDVWQGAASAQMAAGGRRDVVGRRIGIAVDQGRAAHHEARRAEAALHGVVRDERRLHRVQRFALREALDGGDLAATDVDGKQHARSNRHAVEPDRASRAGAPIAADFRPGQPELVAQHFDERRGGFDRNVALDAVDVQRDSDRAGPGDCALAASRRAPAAMQRSRSARSRPRWLPQPPGPCS